MFTPISYAYIALIHELFQVANALVMICLQH